MGEAVWDSTDRLAEDADCWGDSTNRLTEDCDYGLFFTFDYTNGATVGTGTAVREFDYSVDEHGRPTLHLINE